MLETQSKWYLPAPRQLGWHIGFWNLVGALGFTLCGALGFASDSNTACEIGLVWATFVGSWAFLVCIICLIFLVSLLVVVNTVQAKPLFLFLPTHFQGPGYLPTHSFPQLGFL